MRRIFLNLGLLMIFTRLKNLNNTHDEVDFGDVRNWRVSYKFLVLHKQILISNKKFSLIQLFPNFQNFIVLPSAYIINSFLVSNTFMLIIWKQSIFFLLVLAFILGHVWLIFRYHWHKAIILYQIQRQQVRITWISYKGDDVMLTFIFFVGISFLRLVIIIICCTISILQFSEDRGEFTRYHPL